MVYRDMMQFVKNIELMFWGGIAIYTGLDITCTMRNDIPYFDECMKSVFIEIARDVFEMDEI